MNDPDLELIRNLASYEDAYVGSPLITVCIPTYQRARILSERTLPTVLEQSYSNWEAVIVGDALAGRYGARMGERPIQQVRIGETVAEPRFERLVVTRPARHGCGR